MNKKILIPIILIIVLGGGLGVFIWQNQKQQAPEGITDDSISQEQVEKLDPWVTEPADDVVIENLPTGEQVVKNNTQGYQVTAPKDWYVEKPQGGDVSLRVLSPPENTCYQLGFSKLDNSEGKSPEQFYKDTIVAHAEIGEDEYTIEPFDSQFGEAVIITTSAYRWHSKNLYIASEGNIFTFSMVSNDPDSPVDDTCEQLFFDTIKTINLF